MRALYPGVEFYCIPYGQVAGELYDVSQVTGAASSSIFTDNLGHAGDILKDTGQYVWLYAIYGERPVTQPANVNYQTDLRAIAEDVIMEHDPHYDAR